ncbi:MAG: cytochrome c oxidase subunit II, partial [Deltaproteobacteria bacterium CG_4_10_14_0_2_um_filter_43_8]
SFTAIELGEFPIFCAEFCGTAHYGMIGKVKVVEKAAYEKWQNVWELEQRLGINEAEASEKTTTQLSPVEHGKELFTKQGCTACHSTGTNKLVGPGLAGLFGKETTLTDGKKLTVDENYIRRSLMEPNAELVEGFAPLMPTFKGQLSDEEVNHLIAYLKSLQ